MEGDNIVSAARKAIIRHDYSAVLTIFPILKHLKQMKPEFDQVLQVNVMGFERVLWLALLENSVFDQSHAASVPQHGLQLHKGTLLLSELVNQQHSISQQQLLSVQVLTSMDHYNIFPFLPGEYGISCVVDGAVNILAYEELRMRCWGGA